MATLRALRLLQGIEQKTINNTQLETLLSGSASRQSDLPQLCFSTTAKSRILAPETFSTIIGSASAVTGLGSFTVSSNALVANLDAMNLIAGNSTACSALAASTPGAARVLAARDVYAATIGVQTQASGRQTPWASKWKFATKIKPVSDPISMIAAHPETGVLIAGHASGAVYSRSVDGGATWVQSPGGVALPSNLTQELFWSFGAPAAILMPAYLSTTSYWTDGSSGWISVINEPTLGGSGAVSKAVCITSIGRFVAIQKNSGSVAMYKATAGTNFITAALPVAAAWQDVAASSTRAIAVATSATTSAYTINGTNWVAGTALPGANAWTSIASGNGLDDGKFMVSHTSDSTVAYSANNGVSWSTITIPGFEGSYKVVYHSASRAWIVVGVNKLALSTDSGVTWNVLSMPLNGLDTNTLMCGGAYVYHWNGATLTSAF